MKRYFLSLIPVVGVVLMNVWLGCSPVKEHIAPAISENDSLPTMTAHGISNLISDSGIISYKIVAEDWNIYNYTPQKWTFLKGLFMEKFDSTFHVVWYLQADTAYCHDNRIWELRGRVVILNREGTLFESEEFFWDMSLHTIWSNMHMRITKQDTDQQLEGTTFQSNEEMTDYRVTSSVGYTPMNEETEEEPVNPAEEVFGDSVNLMPDPRPAPKPQPYSIP